MEPRPELWTERLRLRGLERIDCDRIVEGLGDERVAYYTARIPRNYGIQDAENFLSSPASAEVWAIELKEVSGMIGAIGLHSRAPGSVSREAELGYWLHPAHWRQGYMREAVAACISYAKSSHLWDCIRATVNTDNPASEAILLASGFTAGRVTDDASSLFRGGPTTVRHFELVLSSET